MRAGSPGHCAKFTSYSMMDLDTNRIVDIQLIQVTIWYIVDTEIDTEIKQNILKYISMFCIVTMILYNYVVKSPS